MARPRDLLRPLFPESGKPSGDSRWYDPASDRGVDVQMARNAVDETSGCLCNDRYLLHERDAKFCAEFDDVLRSGGVHCLTLPPRSPNLNAFAERWIMRIKDRRADLERGMTETLQRIKRVVESGSAA